MTMKYKICTMIILDIEFGWQLKGVCSDLFKKSVSGEGLTIITYYIS